MGKFGRRGLTEETYRERSNCIYKGQDIMFGILNMVLAYGDSTRLVRDYLHCRDETDWGMLTWEQFDQKLKQLHKMRAVLVERGII